MPSSLIPFNYACHVKDTLHACRTIQSALKCRRADQAENALSSICQELLQAPDVAPFLNDALTLHTRQQGTPRYITGPFHKAASTLIVLLFKSFNALLSDRSLSEMTLEGGLEI